jgi:chitinase
VAAVSTTGEVTAVSAGTSTIQATSEGQVGAATLTVSAPVGTPPPAPASGRWVTGYWVGYQRDLYPETAVDFSLMTHLIVGSLGVTKTGGVTRDFFLDPTTGPAVAKTLATRAHQAGRKALLMIGGAGQHDNIAGAASPATVNTFVANLVQAMTDLGYDGIDVDWEPITDADKPNVVVFLQKLRAAKPGIILTVPIGWSSVFDGTGAWFATLAPLTDQLNIMSYEMADAWPGWVSWHESALYGQGGDHPSSVSTVVARYVSYGIPAAKLGVGLGFYGSCWRGPTAPLQAVGSGVVASDNTMSYANIRASYAPKGTYTWDATAKQGYLSFASATGPAGCTLISYEDEQSIAAKGAYVQSQGLGGAMIWTVNQGHLPAAVNGTQDPLLQATYQAVAP